MNRWAPFYNAIRFMVAALLAAGLLGVALGVVGTWAKQSFVSVERPFATLLGMTSLAYGGAEAIGADLPVPTRHWLVPRTWHAYGGDVFATAFGVVLGLGFVTVVPYFGYYVLMAACMTIGGPIAGGVAMMVYALTRAAPVVGVSFFAAHRNYDHNSGIEHRVIRRMSQVNRMILPIRAGLLLYAAALTIPFILKFG